MRRVTFRRNDKLAGLTDHEPASAIKSLPGWLRHLPRHTEGKKSRLFADGTKNLTVKACNPFFDAITAGYLIYLDTDVQVIQGSESPEFTWNWGGEVISTHSKPQVAGMDIPKGFSDFPFKFTNRYTITTPKGYSSLITHPINRPDLPFYTLTGVVDTDKHLVPINLPFLIRNDFEGIIEAGTPIAQVIPLKRDDWDSSIEEYNDIDTQKRFAIFGNKIARSYQKQFWVKKSYK
jgi:hypothetical protein